MDRDKGRLTRIFGFTSRRRLHIIMKSPRVTFCRGTASIIMVRHLDRVPEGSVCDHCVKALREKWEREGWI